MSELTLKQNKAIQEYLTNGGNKTQAYKIAFDCSRMKEETINVKACNFFKEDKVSIRLQELQAQQEKKHEISKDKILTRLKEIIFEQELIGVDKLDLNAMNKAIDTINKMQGYYAPTKEETVLTETQTLPDWFNRK